MLKSPIKNVHELIATFFIVGKFPKAPGTFATAVAGLIYYLIPDIYQSFTGKPQEALILGVTNQGYKFFDSPFWLIFLIALFFIGVYTSTKAEETMGHDNGHIVIDEVVGYWFALYFFAPSLYYIFFGFLLFRLFDIAKPYPIDKLQDLPKGWGVMLDDLFAGFYTIIALTIIDLIANFIK